MKAIPKKYKQGDVVEVDWDDTASSGGWRGRKDSKSSYSGIVQVRSIGYFLCADSKSIRLNMAVDDEDGATLDRQSIPLGCIRKVRRLRRASR